MARRNNVICKDEGLKVSEQDEKSIIAGFIRILTSHLIFIAERMKKSLGMLVNTSPFNSTGHPALSINAGYSEGLPVGMMIIGKHFDETSVLQTAYAFEKLGDRQ